MRVLAFDSTSPRLTVGLADGDKPIGRWDSRPDRHRGNALDELIDRALASAGWRRRDIGGLALVTGPGSLTAIRIGWATATGWSLAMDIPVTGWSVPTVQRRRWLDEREHGVDSLKIGEKTQFCVVHHRGDEFYAYRLDSGDRPSAPSLVVIGQWLPPSAESCRITGPGVLGYRDRWIASLGKKAEVVAESDATVPGDRLALWGEESLQGGHRFSLEKSPLDYGLPPQFRKAS